MFHHLPGAVYLCAADPITYSKSILTPRRSGDRDSQHALGSAIRKLRLKLGESQTELAAKAGITKNMLSLIERGEGNPSWTTLKGIARGLGVTVAELARQAEN